MENLLREVDDCDDSDDEYDHDDDSLLTHRQLLLSLSFARSLYFLTFSFSRALSVSSFIDDSLFEAAITYCKSLVSNNIQHSIITTSFILQSSLLFLCLILFPHHPHHHPILIRSSDRRSTERGRLVITTPGNSNKQHYTMHNQVMILVT